jgi:hypothetical protein
MPPVTQYAASSIAVVIQQLQAAMQIQHVIASPASPASPSPPITWTSAVNAERVEWIPEDRDDVPPTGFTSQNAAGEVCAEKQTDCVVSVYAADFGRCEQLVDALTATLDTVLSRAAFAFRSRGKYMQAGEGNRGWTFRRTITIKGPVFDQLWLVAPKPRTATSGIDVQSGSTTSHLDTGI